MLVRGAIIALAPLLPCFLLWRSFILKWVGLVLWITPVAIAFPQLKKTADKFRKIRVLMSCFVALDEMRLHWTFQMRRTLFFRPHCASPARNIG